MKAKDSKKPRNLRDTCEVVSAKLAKEYLPLLLSGIKSTGTLKNGLLYVQEMLPGKVFDELNAFLGYIHDYKEGKVGSGNIDDYYMEFRLTTKPSHREHFFITNKVVDKTEKKSLKVIKKGDKVIVMMDALDSFTGGNEVVRVNKANNEVTIKLGKGFQVK